HHYRTVNACIDRLLLQVGLLLQQHGYRYMPVAASQSLPEDGLRTHRGLYSHKKAAVAAGLGAIGKSTLFLDHLFGARVRLGTLFTDAPLPSHPIQIPVSPCETCDRCVRACPAGAITGANWQPGLERDALLAADACNRYMRDHFMKIGRGSVCGICVRVCPYGQISPLHREASGSDGPDR
ncbi:MAG: epoxyqueuosine reductase, partial [Clostridiaceae bacterium]|nr:epoxyqueuosine reductase [Clostridiaceae bacterium]